MILTIFLRSLLLAIGRPLADAALLHNFFPFSKLLRKFVKLRRKSQRFQYNLSIFHNLFFAEKLFQEALYAHFPFFNLLRLMVEKPGSFKELVLYNQPLVLCNFL